ncbi:MAG TPA: stage III sporulation protein AF [Bacillota bacterium]
MQDLADWLKRIIAAVILAGFLELILPQNNLKGVTKMVMGLVIITLLFQPFTHLLRLPSEIRWDLPGLDAVDSNPASSRTAAVVENGFEMREKWAARLTQDSRAIVETKVKTLVSLIDEVRLKQLQMEYSGSNLVKVHLLVSPAVPGGLSETLLKTITKRLNESVRLVSDLPADRIEVIWNE